jgi:hypothetical protein
MTRSTRSLRSRRSTLAVRQLEDRSLPSSVQGTVFNDANRNQVFDPGESALPGWTVYMDNDRDTVVDPGEALAVTDANGNYFIDTSSVPTQNGYHFMGLDLQVGSGGRWLFTTRPEPYINPTSEPLAVRDFGVHFEPYVSVEPVGAETLVNTTIAGTQNDPRVAADAAGNYVVVWSTPVSGGTSIVARMYNADGTPRTNEFTVASGAVSEQQVAIADNGRFVVAWSATSASYGTHSALVRIYNSTGTPVTSAVTVSAATKKTYSSVDSVAMDAVGNIGVLYRTNKAGGGFTFAARMTVQRVTAAGALNGNPIDVAGVMLTDAGLRRIGMDSTGRFAVMWSDVKAPDANGNELFVYAQRFSAAGQNVGSQITVAAPPNGASAIFLSSASMNGAGRFVISWTAWIGDPFMAQVFDWGTPVGGPVMVNQPGSPMLGIGWTSTSDIDSAGNVTFAWVHGYGNYSPGAREILFRRLTANGTLEPEYVVNTTTQGMQLSPALASTGNDRFVVAWQGYGPGDDSGVFMQRFKPLGMSPMGDPPPKLGEPTFPAIWLSAETFHSDADQPSSAKVDRVPLAIPTRFEVEIPTPQAAEQNPWFTFDSQDWLANLTDQELINDMTFVGL